MKSKLSKYTDENINKKIKRRNIKSVLRSIILYLLVAVLSVYFAIVLWGNFSERNSGFQINGFIVISGSMIPTLDINDLVVSMKVKQEELKEGDIISFVQENQVITHRINKIIEENGEICYETKGDNNNTIDDNLVKYEDIMGKYIFKILKIGYIVRNLQTQIGIIIVITIIFIRELYVRNKESKEIIRHEKRVEMEEKNKGDK